MKGPSSDKLAGILITVSIHLAVIIVLLLTIVHPRLKKEQTVMELDFSTQEKIEELEKQLARSKALNEKLDRMLEEEGVTPEKSKIKNLRVNSALKDDRGTDAEQLYKDAERIQKEYEQNMSRKDDDLVAISPKDSAHNDTTRSQDETYTGPSVLSYSMEGRKGSYLPIPAYKCIGSGEVTVIVTIDPSGKVLQAKIQDDISSSDKCLREYALKAASQSRFSKKSDAPARQIGNIVYEFIAQ
ncbi:MAG TPA: hypothetical protein DHU75_06945 [Rikenellaceae bacterium]|nr:hypothetical protein [Rikenellaceae bacterium]